MDWGNGMNISNLLNLGTAPSPQGSPSAYQPGGMNYGGLGAMPYTSTDIQSSVNQSQVAPSMNSMLGAMPSNTGVARNSPARAYLAAMGAQRTNAQSLSNRAMIGLNMGGANANAYNQSQIAASHFAQQQGQMGGNMMMDLLSPFLSRLFDRQQ